MTVDFEAASYSVSEGGAIDVCLILTGNTEINVVVTLQVEDGTASMCNTYNAVFSQCHTLCIHYRWD